MKYLLSIIITILLSGCVATGTKFDKVKLFSPDTVTVYVLRQSMISGGFYCADIYEYGKHKGCLKNGGYLRFEASPGSVLFRTEYMTKNKYKTIEAKAGDVIFLEWYIKTYMDGNYIDKIIVHNKEDGTKLLSGLNLSS
jgi:hypothetical protein